MSSRLARALERPLAERDRARAFGAAALTLVLAAGALSLIAPPHPGRQTPKRPAIAVPPARPAPVVPLAPPPQVLRAGRRFLADYLPFLYGHTTGREFHAASAALARSLTARPVRVASAMRRRHPRVVTLASRRLDGGPRWLLSATIADGAVRYPIELLVTTGAHSATVVGLGED